MASRQLTIKTGVVNRLVKEVASYKAEAIELTRRADKMEAEGQDVYEVRQQRRVQADSQMMIPDSEKRLAKAIAELKELLESSKDELEESDEWKDGTKALENATLPPAALPAAAS